jgi:phosphate transport system substrate-binding protein
MSVRNIPPFGRDTLPTVVAAALLFAAGCGGESSKAPRRAVLQNIGSDTMVNLATAWAEAYAAVEPSVSVEVSGGGSGQGIAALINGSCDIANSSRALEPKEVDTLKEQTGKEPREFLVGYDALSVFVHKDNPIESISLEQLRQIYSDDGGITKWSELGVTVPGAKGDEIIRVSRQNNSGTYHYFREAVVGHGHEFKLGSIDMNGSKDAVELIARTPNAIGYSGMGYATPGVKALKVSRAAGEEAVAPSVESVMSQAYPIARPMFMYTAGAPSSLAQAYLDWIHSAEAQKIVAETGYVPLKTP